MTSIYDLHDLAADRDSLQAEVASLKARLKVRHACLVCWTASWVPIEKIEDGRFDFVDKGELIRCSYCYLEANLKAKLEEAQGQMCGMEIKLRAADAMAKIIDDWIMNRHIDARSALGDARLDYSDPHKYEAKENAALKAKDAKLATLQKVAEAARKALEAIASTKDGNFWKMRQWCDKHNLYIDDMSDERAWVAVAEQALADWRSTP